MKMKHVKQLLPLMFVLLVLAIFALACPPAAQNRQPQQQPPAATPPEQPVQPQEPAVTPSAQNGEPIAAAPDNDMGGCWVMLYPRTEYQGHEVKVPGPGKLNLTDIPELQDVNWGDHINSLRVGPNARLRVVGTADFAGETLALGPGEEVADLGIYPIQGNIASLDLECLGETESAGSEAAEGE
jgi:hypothetical protein